MLPDLADSETFTHFLCRIQTGAQLGGHAAKAALAELPSELQVDATIFGNGVCFL